MGVARFKIPVNVVTALAKKSPLTLHVKATHGEQSYSVSGSIDMTNAQESSPVFRFKGSSQVIEERLPASLYSTDTELSLPIPNAALWSPDEPNLYDATIELSQDGKIIDTVHTYFGMRKVSRGIHNGSEHEYILLNNKPIYLRGALTHLQSRWHLYAPERRVHQARLRESEGSRPEHAAHSY